jgi:hypothetical protein
MTARPSRNSYMILITALAIALCASSAMAGGHDFIDEARALYRAAACGAGALPAGIDAAAVRDHCTRMDRNIDNYRANFINKATPFLAAIRPRSLPGKIVVPFGGGDLLPAMVVYPDADEITTISLESAGDPRRLLKATPAQLRQALAMYRSNVGFMLMEYDNSNENVRNMDRGAIPNQLAFSLTAMAILGYEPVSLKFFRIEDDGSLHYFTLEEITSMEKVRAQRLKGTWIDTDFSVAFRNMELVMHRVRGGGTIIHRHIAYNLDNQHFSGSGLQKHLEGKGKIAAMIKGASYLPWFDNFSSVRDYLLGHMTYCVSDSTGILPRHAAAAGFTQETYGKFSGAFLDNDGGANAAAMRALFQSQPNRPIPFQFGYSDIHRAHHLIITRKK